MSHKSAVFLLRWSATLPCAPWALGKKTSSDYLLMQESILTIPTKKRQKMKVFRKDFLIFSKKNGHHKCQPFTIPTFHALNVRFSVKILAKIFEPAPKQGFHSPDDGDRKSTRPLQIGRFGNIQITMSIYLFPLKNPPICLRDNLRLLHLPFQACVQDLHPKHRESIFRVLSNIPQQQTLRILKNLFGI